MTEDVVGKEQEVSAMIVSETKIVKRPKPTLMQIGARWMASDGRWHPELAAEYVVNHGGLKRWIAMGELAKVFFGGGSPSNKTRCRQRLHRVFQHLLEKGLLLVVEYGGERHAAQACKIYDAKSEVERQYINARLKSMAHMKMLKTEQFERALCIVQNDEPVNDEPVNEA